MARRRRRTPPSARHDHRPLPRTHDPSRREESRPPPRRRRLAGPRTRPRAGQGSRPRRPRQSRKGTRAGYTYIHSAVDGLSRLAYTECHDDETAATVVAFLSRARVFFRAHGITRYTRIVTDNEPAYTSKHFARHVGSFTSRHQRIRPYTPQHNGKVERYQGLMSSEVLYARPWTSEQQRRNGIAGWVNHYNYHRPHTAAGGKPPASRLKTSVNNVQPSCS